MALKRDKWYEKHGVKPPEHIVHFGSESVLNDGHTHTWKQVGNFLECDGGHYVHGIPFDHLNLKLVGTSSKGEPIMEALTLTYNNGDKKTDPRVLDTKPAIRDTKKRKRRPAKKTGS